MSKQPATLILRLYVTGKTAASARAIGNLKALCSHDYEVEIVDVFENPQLAEDHKIMATPTLLKLLPLPLRRIIGDLSDTDKVLIGLDLLNPADVEGRLEHQVAQHPDVFGRGIQT